MVSFGFGCILGIIAGVIRRFGRLGFNIFFGKYNAIEDAIILIYYGSGKAMHRLFLD